jgi:hypothetical protein
VGGRKWSLPKALISHYSHTLKDRCNQETRISLPKEDPAIIQLFVEWLYDGSYSVNVPLLTTENSEINIDAQGWVLGDRLRSTAFKNYAMSRLYAQYTPNFAPKSITTSDIDYAFTHSQSGSNLRAFFEDLLATHFLNQNRAVGLSKQWYDLLQEHVQLGLFVFEIIRNSEYRAKHIKEQNMYMDVENAHSM